MYAKEVGVVFLRPCNVKVAKVGRKITHNKLNVSCSHITLGYSPLLRLLPSSCNWSFHTLIELRELSSSASYEKCTNVVMVIPESMSCKQWLRRFKCCKQVALLSQNPIKYGALDFWECIYTQNQNINNNHHFVVVFQRSLLASLA